MVITENALELTEFRLRSSENAESNLHFAEKKLMLRLVKLPRSQHQRQNRPDWYFFRSPEVCKGIIHRLVKKPQSFRDLVV
jgi:hypothetical protein